MIPTKQNIDSNLSGLESQNFTIQITDKSFRVLLDGLYTNKEQSIVRELWTNAYDSHVAAGIGDKPFSCKLPSTFDPVFSVRDYGTSMHHEDVMNLYSTVFASTKTDTNDQVGCLGLGSKSPFCYTDSFTVIAYSGTIKRVYLAALNSDGIPTITHLGNESSDEPRGLEITFAVAATEIERFRKAADNVGIGFNPIPTVTGANITIPEPIFVGDGLSVYKRKNSWDSSGTAGITNNMIKMGPVAYPLPDELCSPITNTINATCKIVLDVPVGSVDFTANREALQLTQSTRQYLTALIEDNMKRFEFTARADILDASNTYLEACKSFHYWRSMIRLDSFKYQDAALAPTVSSIVLYNKHFSKDLVIKVCDKRTVERINTRSFGISLDEMDNIMFVINRDPKMSRRMIRFKAFSESRNGKTYWLDHPTSDQISRLMRCFGLKREQFMLIQDIPDVEVEKRSSSGGTSFSSDTLRGAFMLSKHSNVTKIMSTTHEIFNTEYYWIGLESTSPNVDFVLPKCRIAADISDNGSWRRQTIINTARFLEIDLNEHPIILLGKQARNKLGVSDDHNLDNVMDDLIRSRHSEFLRMHQASNGNGPINDKVLDLLHMDQPTNIMPTCVDRVLMEVYGEDIYNQVHPFKSKYPLLFPFAHNVSSDVDDSAIIEYIQFIDNK